MNIDVAFNYCSELTVAKGLESCVMFFENAVKEEDLPVPIESNWIAFPVRFLFVL